jgi:futalosine hydrolase
MSEICTMQVLVVTATELEIAPFRLENPDADILVTGVGVPATMYQLLKRLHQMDYDLVIQAGIAGSFKKEIAPGSCGLVQKDCFADLGVQEAGRISTLFDMGLAPAGQLPYSNGWLVNDHNAIVETSLPAFCGITVNTVHDQEEINELYLAKFHPDVESMEGAALHYCCLMVSVPFLQLRAISNYVGERDKSNWKMKEAIQALNQTLNELVRSIAPQPNTVNK